MAHLKQEQNVELYPGPFSVGPRKVHGALCEDGKQRTATCSEHGADTFFSIPARIKVRGKTVSGYVTVDTGRICARCLRIDTSHDFLIEDGSRYDFSAPGRCPDGELADYYYPRGIHRFIAYSYGKNAHLVKQDVN